MASIEVEEDKKYANLLVRQKDLYEVRFKGFYLDEEIFKVDELIEKAKPTSFYTSDDFKKSWDDTKNEMKMPSPIQPAKVLGNWGGGGEGVLKRTLHLQFFWLHLLYFSLPPPKHLFQDQGVYGGLFVKNFCFVYIVGLLCLWQ